MATPPIILSAAHSMDASHHMEATWVPAVSFGVHTPSAVRRREFRGAHVGAGGWGPGGDTHIGPASGRKRRAMHARTIDATAWCTVGTAHRAGKWAQAQSDARTIGATAWCTVYM
eukprot:3545416-Prymnesium_polylepis.1